MIIPMSQELASPFEDEAPASADETLDFFITRSRRKRVPIRRSFLRASDGETGPLAAFVTGRRSLALDLFVLHSGLASAPPWDVRATAAEWARMLDMPPSPSSETAIARQWRWLADQKLVKTQRTGHGLKITKRLDDGSGRRYKRPTKAQHGYFNVPFAYFTERWHHELKLPGKAALLIALGQAPTFDLPLPRAAGWYGLRTDTLARGLVELQDLGLVKVWQRAKKAPNTRYGVTRVNHYALTGSFARVPLEATEPE